MKKFLTIFMALLLCVGLAGCGSNKPVDEFFKDEGWETFSQGEYVDEVVVGFKNDDGYSVYMYSDYQLVLSHQETGVATMYYVEDGNHSTYFETASLGSSDRSCDYYFDTKEIIDESDYLDIYRPCTTKTKEKLQEFHIDNFLEELGVDKEDLRKYLEEQVDNYISSNNL